MSLMSLRANQDFYELQNMTFSIITSLQCGVPLSAHVLRSAATWPPDFDLFGHQALNSSIENLRISTHDEVVRKMRTVLAQLGRTVTCRSRDIPRSGAHPRPQQRGDIYISTPGLCQCQPTGPPSDHSRVVLDVSIVHSTTRSAATGFSFQKGEVSLTETRKVRTYEDNYGRRSLAFGPLIADSIGQIGSSALRFFHRVARFCSSSTSGTTSQSDSFASALYHRLRLSFLHASFEATAERLMRVGPLEASSCDRSTSPVSPVMSAPAVQSSSPAMSQSSLPVVVVSPPRRTPDGSDVMLANSCFVPFTQAGSPATVGYRVSLVPLPTVFRFFPAPSGSQSLVAVTSGPVSAASAPALGTATTVLSLDSQPLSGSVESSPPASGSLQSAGVTRVLFEGPPAASAASPSL